MGTPRSGVILLVNHFSFFYLSLLFVLQQQLDTNNLYFADSRVEAEALAHLSSPPCLVAKDSPIYYELSLPLSSLLQQLRRTRPILQSQI